MTAEAHSLLGCLGPMMKENSAITPARLIRISDKVPGLKPRASSVPGTINTRIPIIISAEMERAVYVLFGED